MNTIYIDLMVFPVGGLGIAAAVFMAGPSSNNTTKPVSLGHFLRGSVSSFLGYSVWGCNGGGCREHLQMRKRMSIVNIYNSDLSIDRNNFRNPSM